MNLPANAFQQASFVNCRIWADSNGDDALSVLRGVNGECHGIRPSDEHTSYSVDQRHVIAQGCCAASIRLLADAHLMVPEG